jgi:hypothetical protein
LSADVSACISNLIPEATVEVSDSGYCCERETFSSFLLLFDPFQLNLARIKFLYFLVQKLIVLLFELRALCYWTVTLCCLFEHRVVISITNISQHIC